MLTLTDRKVIRDNLSKLEKIVTKARTAALKRDFSCFSVDDRRLFLGLLEKSELKHADIKNQIDFIEKYYINLDREYSNQLIRQASDDITAYAEAINREWIPARHHVLMLNKLEDLLYGRTQRLIISLPVGHAKTVYASKVFPTYTLGKDPHERVIWAGHTQRFVETQIAAHVRTIINSDAYSRIFPKVEIMTDTAAEMTFAPVREATNGSYVVKGAQSAISGYRASLIGADDLYPTLAEAQSSTYRKAVYGWFFGDLMTRSLPYTRIVLVCTRWHRQDIIGELLDAAEKGTGQKWETVIMSALCDEKESDPLEREVGDALWPEFFDKAFLEAKKSETPPKIWRCLYQGKPIDDEGAVVKANWFQYWDSLPDEKIVKKRFVAVDTAGSAEKKSDYTAGTAWIQTHDNRYFLTDIIRGKWDYYEIIRQINEFARKNKASAILIEDTAMGRSILTSQKHQMACPMVPIKPENKNKEYHFQEISPMFMTGQVYLPRAHALLPDLEQEMLEFPESKHDDLVDSMTVGLRWGKGKSVARGIFKLIGVN